MVCGLLRKTAPVLDVRGEHLVWRRRRDILHPVASHADCHEIGPSAGILPPGKVEERFPADLFARKGRKTEHENKNLEVPVVP